MSLEKEQPPSPGRRESEDAKKSTTSAKHGDVKPEEAKGGLGGYIVRTPKRAYTERTPRSY
jgi:hypothetical protein